MNHKARVELSRVKVDELKFAPYNPRKMSDEELKKLKRSITEFGYVEPIVVNKRTMHVVGGNQRLKVLKELGIEIVDVVFVDMPLEKEKALNLALNRIQGEWDLEKLKEILEELDDQTLSLTGFNEDEIDNLLKEFEPIEPPDELFESSSAEDQLKKLTVFYEPEREMELIEILESNGFEYKK